MALLIHQVLHEMVLKQAVQLCGWFFIIGLSCHAGQKLINELFRVADALLFRLVRVRLPLEVLHQNHNGSFSEGVVDNSRNSQSILLSILSPCTYQNLLTTSSNRCSFRFYKERTHI
ncbi:unnamed protein product [Tenebrio molitor]|nr:unnamed protein product [Tenebrio molitor]